MKNLSLLTNAILAVAIVVLFVLVLSNKSSNTATRQVVRGNDSLIAGKLPMAYVNIDSLLLNYQFAKDANESLIKKQENSRLTINSRAQSLQTEMAEFQKKLEANAFLSRERAEQEQARLLKKQQDLQQLDGKLSQQLLQDQQKMSEELRDTINAFMKDYNKDKKYEMIISNTSSDNVLYAAEGYDITDEVIKMLNERCANKK